jgi:hypothetical protein
VNDPIAVILPNVPNATPVGEFKWKGRCLSHDDPSRSLLIEQISDGTCLVRCCAGCPLNQVLESLGLRLRNLFRDCPSVRKAVAS